MGFSLCSLEDFGALDLKICGFVVFRLLDLGEAICGPVLVKVV